jgi:hypothetical protein
MIDDSSIAAIHGQLRALEACWRAMDFAGIRALWDDSGPPLYLAEESAEPALSWEALEKYWSLTGTIATRAQVRIDNIRCHALSPDLISAFYNMHWDVAMKVGAPLGGDNRVCTTFRRRPDGWRIVQYIEAPLAPVMYMKKLYERNVTPGFS